jgi:hypothetical protein
VADCNHAISLKPAGSMMITTLPGLPRCCDSLIEACSVARPFFLLLLTKKDGIPRSLYAGCCTDGAFVVRVCPIVGEV